MPAFINRAIEAATAAASAVSSGWSWNDGAGKPVSLPLTGVIKGWGQGIPGMHVGGRRELIIPPSLGYKNVAAGPGIAANDTLVFVIDLLHVS